MYKRQSEIIPVPGDYVLFCHKESSAGHEHENWKVGLVLRVENSKSSPRSTVYIIEYRAVVKQKDKKPEEWKVAKNLTNRHLRELVLLFTMEEIKSPPGSEEHLRRLRAGPKVKNVRFN